MDRTPDLDVAPGHASLADNGERAREAALEFQALADNIPTLCWMAYAEGDIYWYNARWYEYTGTSAEDQAGWGWESVHDPEVLPAVVERWKHSLATGTAFEMTFPLRGADGSFRPFLTRVVPIRDESGTIVRWFGSNTDVSDMRASEARLATQIAELKALYDSAPIGLAFFSRDYRYLRVNEELAAINGVPVEDHIGRTIREVLSDQAPEVEPIIDRVFATGVAMRDLEVSGETPHQPGVIRHWLAGFYPVKDANGTVEAVGAWVIEISERKAAEQRELLLAREVDHRAKNLLTVVQSVMQLTRADTVQELKDSVIGRIQSLARAHALLANARWEGVELSQLVGEEMAPFSDGKSKRVTISGEPLRLWPAAAQSLALVIHELATNAAKYGALSTLDGSVEIEWRVEPDSQVLMLDWTEQSSAPAVEPQDIGFGSRIITASVERQLQGRVTKHWRPDGLHCRLEFPLRAAAPPEEG